MPCKKCDGTGRYAYDKNHTKICEDCCKHEKGWWELTEVYGGYIEGSDNRCCVNGCGAMYRDVHKKTK